MNLVILASARENSNTEKALQKLCPFSDYHLVDLRVSRIDSFDYEGSYSKGDQFFEIAHKMGMSENIVFATPVYWYAMSGLMKTFFDRLTDILHENKHIGKALAGKNTYLISTGSDEKLPPGFDEPFRLTSKYFDMKYKQSFYLSSKEIKAN